MLGGDEKRQFVGTPDILRVDDVVPTWLWLTSTKTSDSSKKNIYPNVILR